MASSVLLCGLYVWHACSMGRKYILNHVNNSFIRVIGHLKLYKLHNVRGTIVKLLLTGLAL